METTCCLIGFHGNHSNIMTSLAASILDFQIFNFFSKSNLNTENSETTPFSDWNLQIVRSIVKYQYLGENSRSFSEKLHFRSQHTSCVTYYDDVVNRDVT